jgi:sulfatase maturation enzyme AslB (radical SAM superfamily)
MSLKDKPNFCIQPFIHLASWNDGAVPLCCIAQPEQGLNLNTHTPVQIWNSEQFKSARLKFIAGEKLPQCASCWKEEASGIKSHRIVENFMWEKKLGSEFLETLVSNTHSDGSVDHTPLTLDLRLSNVCNLQCVMCRPRDSSKWLADSKKLAETLVSPAAKNDWHHKSMSIQDTTVFDWFERLTTQESLDEFLGDIRHIIFGGGEPLLIKEHDRFIRRLVESGNSKQIELRYHTNGTQLSETILELWSHFKHVELMISIDDWGDRNEYVRYPAKWSTIKKNLDRLDQTPDTISINILTSIHAMNIYNLPDFALELLNSDWRKICKRNGKMIYLGTVHWPQYMSTKVLPADIKQKIIDKWNSHEQLKQHTYWNDRIVPQIEFMLSGDDSRLFNDLLDYIDKLDAIRPIKFRDVYSEYYNILMDE